MTSSQMVTVLWSNSYCHAVEWEYKIILPLWIKFGCFLRFKKSTYHKIHLIPHIGISPRQIKACTWVFTAIFFLHIRKLETTKISIYMWKYKQIMMYIYTAVYYTSKKWVNYWYKKQWINLTIITLRKADQPSPLQKIFIKP